MRELTHESGSAKYKGPRAENLLPCTSALSHCSHIVQFYDSDQFLLDNVSKFLAAGLLSSQPAVAIMHADRLEPLKNNLRLRDVNVSEVLSEGRLVLLDAEETLSKFMVNGLPNTELVQSVLGAVLAPLQERFGKIHAYGEMVNILWLQGNKEATLQLEREWNALSEIYSFSLLCGYSMGGFGKEQHTQFFTDICSTHKITLPAEDLSRFSDTETQRQAIAILQHKAKVLEAQLIERKAIEDELRRRTQELRQREQELTDFVENASVGLHWVDARGIIKWVNRAELTLLGYAREEYVGHHIAEFHADSNVIGDILERLSRGETLDNYEARLKCKDGTIRTVAICSNVYRDEGRFVHTRCFTRDITALKAAEEKLRDREQRLSTIFEQTVAGLVQIDLTGRFLLVNDHFCEIVGRSREELLNLTYQDITCALDVPCNLDHFEKLITDGKPFVIEKRYVRPDGNFVWVTNSVSLLRDASGAPCGAVAAVVDISDRKNAQEALERRAEELAKSNTELERFAHVASHDLKEPLRAVRSYVQLLGKKYQTLFDEDAKEYIGFAVAGANRMQTLIDDLLSYASVDSRKAKLELVDCNQLLEEVKANLKEPIEETGTSLIIEPLPSVVADRTQLLQLIQNLLSNSIKFRNGQVPVIHISAKPVKNSYQFQIRDNGIGIEKEYFERIFVLFQRLHENHRYPGTGLGLAICKKIVDRHGGNIWLESEVGKGTTFYFTLPYENPTESTSN